VDDRSAGFDIPNLDQVAARTVRLAHLGCSRFVPRAFSQAKVAGTLTGCPTTFPGVSS
jgi:hypothetical protein